MTHKECLDLVRSKDNGFSRDQMAIILGMALAEDAIISESLRDMEPYALRAESTGMHTREYEDAQIRQEAFCMCLKAIENAIDKRVIGFVFENMGAGPDLAA